MSSTPCRALASQRVNGLVLGYEDLNDHDELRRDPLHGLIAGKSDPLGQDPILERDKGKALAAHSTLNRLELSAESLDKRYHKIQAQPEKIKSLLIKRGVKAIPRKVREIVLDFDATDDPLHGAQEGAFFHGFYRHYCCLPLYCFCGNIPLFAWVLRGTELEHASIGQIRLRLFKIAARFKVSVRRIHIELCSPYPLKGLFAKIHHRLTALPDMPPAN